MQLWCNRTASFAAPEIARSLTGRREGGFRHSPCLKNPRITSPVSSSATIPSDLRGNAPYTNPVQSHGCNYLGLFK
eukprot:731659-Prorocentrum_minimum.AAC.2